MASPNRTDDEERWGSADVLMGDAEEQRVLFAALDSFYQYARVAHYNTTHLRRQSFYALPQSHWQLLASTPFSYLETLNAVDDGIDDNAELATAILRTGLESFGQALVFKDSKGKFPWQGAASSADIEKARSTLRQFYRDWSSEGAAERKACYEPIVRDLRNERSALPHGSSPMTVLVPGAGLGRLVFDLCHDGFNVEGNEISYHQLLASSYILNYCPRPKAHTIYPWIHSFSNHKTRSAQLQSVEVPDVHPGMALREVSPGEMSMSASDFLLLYDDASHSNMYDAVATCFFLDTAPNPIRYIETIRNCLKSGGIWTNLGPLLWHFENNPPGKQETEGGDEPATNLETTGIADPGSVELTDDEVVALVEKLGFSVETREAGTEAGYIQDPTSMLQSTYRVSHWVARKL